MGSDLINLPALCRARNWRNLAFIGVTKHAGKTTALNAFIAQLQAGQGSFTPAAAGSDVAAPPVATIADAAAQTPPAAECIGLLSIGLDGERLDTIMGIRKPPVDVTVGTLVASAEGALAQSDAGLEYLEVLPIESPLGPVLVAQVTRPGHVLLAGVRQRQHVQQVVASLRRHGAAWCLVDGAFDRVAAAAPHLVDAAVLAVGATAGATVDAVIARAAPVVQRFLLPEVSGELRDELEAAHRRGEIGVWAHPLAQGVGCNNDQGRDYDQPSPLVCLPKNVATSGPWLHPDWPGADQAVTAVYLPGALTTPLLEGFSAHTQASVNGVDLVVAHPAQVLAHRSALEAWYRRGHRLSVWTPLPLAAIAVNPHSVNGADLQVAELAAAVQSLVPSVPVFNAATSELEEVPER